MVSIVLASHGTFSEGIKMSGQMIFGPQQDVAAVTLMPEMGPDDLRAKILEAVDGFEEKDQVLFLVDLQGGTPWNQISLLLDEPSVMGVESLQVDQLNVRVVARTLPGKQFDVGRDLRARALIALRADGHQVGAGLDTAEPSGRA